MRTRAIAFAVAALAVATSAGASTPPTKKFGAWSVGVMADKAGLFAATVNDSGGLLGLYCYKETSQCVWLLANDIRCQNESRSPVLLNSDAGALSTEIICVNLGDKPRYAFSNFDQIENAILKSEWIGIAFPLESGKFTVSRFRLQGAKDAVAVVKKVLEAVAEPANSTKDQTF